MKQLKQEMVRRNLHQRRARRMTETRISLCDQVREFFVCERVTGKWTHDTEGDFLITQARHCRDVSF